MLVLLFLSTVAFAKDKATYQSLTDISMIVRDPVFSSDQRLYYLDFTRKMMVKKLAEEMNVPETELNLTFMKNPSNARRLLGDPWIDLQTEFYTSLHQENFHQRWTSLQRLVKFTDYGKGIYKTMIGHLGNYSPVNENRFYLRWHNVTLNTDTKTRQFSIPYFLMSSQIKDLVALEAHVPYEELVKEKDMPTFLAKTPQFKRVKRQELAEKMELARRIFIRAVSNAAKTVGSIHYLTGAHNRHSAEGKITTFVDRYCETCTIKDRKDAVIGAMAYLDNMKKSVSYNNTTAVATKFCSSLRNNLYHWNVDRLKPTPVELMIDNTRVIDYYTVHKLKKKNVEAMAKTVLEQDLGVLFITNALTLLDKAQEPIGTKLECTKASAQKDSKLVQEAIDEAEKNVSQYITHVGKKVSDSKYDLSATNSLIEYFVQTNQAATIEATSAYPQGIGWVLKSLAELDQDTNRRKKVDSVITWGGAILGIGLTLTGVGAPEGVSIMIASIGVVKGATAGTYYFVRAQQEKNFAHEMQLSKNAGSGLTEENLRLHYSEYKTLKILYIKEFAQSALNFANLHRMCMNRTGDVGKTHSIFRRVFETAKATGKDTAVETVQEMVIQLAVNAS